MRGRLFGGSQDFASAPNAVSGNRAWRLVNISPIKQVAESLTKATQRTLHHRLLATAADTGIHSLVAIDTVRSLRLSTAPRLQI